MWGALLASLLAVASAFTTHNTTAQDPSALCLAGDPGQFYLSKATTNKNWMITFQGGGWCYTAADCAARSKAPSPYGSSAIVNYFAAAGVIPVTWQGFFSNDCAINPEFCDYNIVQLVYCDGGSFTGDQTDPLTVGTDVVYFRGFRILKAVLNMLLAPTSEGGLGMIEAEKVILNGCSAGGLSALLHADYVKGVVTAAIPTLQTYKVLACSAFFPTSIPNLDGDLVFGDQSQSMFTLHNSSGGVNQDCIAAKDSSSAWNCMTSEGVTPYVQSPVFLVQSIYDAYQSQCIFAGKAVADDSPANGNCSTFEDWQGCLGANYDFNTKLQIASTNFAYFNPQNCTTSQIDTLTTSWADQISSRIDQLSTFSAAGNGKFLHSCHTHCGAQLDGNFVGNPGVDVFQKVSVNGVTMQQAILAWWSADITASALSHTYTPCSWFQVEGSPVCLDTCPNADYSSLQSVAVSVNVSFSSARSSSDLSSVKSIYLFILQTYFARVAASWTVEELLAVRRSNAYTISATGKTADASAYQTTASTDSFSSSFQTKLAEEGFDSSVSGHTASMANYTYTSTSNGDDKYSAGEKAGIAVAAFVGVLIFATAASMLGKLLG